MSEPVYEATINGIRGRWVSTKGREFGEGLWICCELVSTIGTWRFSDKPTIWNYVFLPDTETLRDRFAMAAALKLLGTPKENEDQLLDLWMLMIAQKSYKFAGAMMEARK